ncbi:hypothetical protein AVEN_120700-1 [Araneus ventricosus]|uniref:Uncharacterized protein n=1 Tax=Araneus ventricosus TaxID=182803 RepID=A0A4Y2PC96_ARAVE|nr:hypothetical protein AVEN_120700-1 [Araneus ventricosus]
MYFYSILEIIELVGLFAFLYTCEHGLKVVGSLLPAVDSARVESVFPSLILRALPHRSLPLLRRSINHVEVCRVDELFVVEVRYHYFHTTLSPWSRIKIKLIPRRVKKQKSRWISYHTQMLRVYLNAT